MKIYGHRGAAGLALENSHESMKAALKYSLDGIEIDVHLTKDGEVVVLHDKNTKRVSNENVLVNKKTLSELRALTLHNKQGIPTLNEVLSTLKEATVIIDIKDHGVAEKIPDIIRHHPKINALFASFIHDELKQIHQYLPNAPIYVLEHFSPIEIIHSARSLGASGIGLNKWLMNPLAYRLARRYNLEFYVYTLNSPWMARFYQRFYPDVSICTDHPERFALRKSNGLKLKNRRKPALK